MNNYTVYILKLQYIYIYKPNIEHLSTFHKKSKKKTKQSNEEKSLKEKNWLLLSNGLKN